MSEDGGIGPYLVVLVVAVVIGVAVAVYVFGYRHEILTMLSQNPV